MNARKIAITAAVIFGTVAFVYLLFVFRQALVLFVFSLGIAAAARPFVDRLALRGVPRTRALILVYTLFVGGFALLLFAVGASLLREIQQLTDSLASLYDHIYMEWPQGTDLQQTVVAQLPAPSELYESFSVEQQNSALQGLLGFTATSANFLTQVVTILILSIYWSIDRVHFERLWLSLLPVESRAHSRNVWRNIERDFGSYARSEMLQSILAGLLLGVGLWLMGIRYPTLLALFAALAWLIPYLGGVLAIVPVTLTALVSQGPGMAIFATAYAVGVLFFLEFYVEVRFIRRQQFSSLLSILLIIAFIEPFGLLGFLVAPPLAAAIELIFRYNLASRQQPAEMESIQRISELRARLLQVREVTESSREPLEPQTLNMLSRLENLVDKADDLLEKERMPEKPNRKNA